jgi:hypothetical protein
MYGVVRFILCTVVRSDVVNVSCVHAAHGTTSTKCESDRSAVDSTTVASRQTGILYSSERTDRINRYMVGDTRSYQ